MLHYRSNGKLLLTGEYLVLKGAKALALPTRFGQDLQVEPIENRVISWTSMEKGRSWFRAEFEFDHLAISAASDLEVAEKLQEILRAAKQMNPEFLTDPTMGFDVQTNLEFKRNWGLGSSSTLIANVANWAKVDPYLLNKTIFKGSGYDIACARNNTPVLYQLIDETPHVQQVDFKPPFADQIYFVWLNRKQETLLEIGRFYKQCNFEKWVDQISQLTTEIIQNSSVSEFMRLLEEHETIISNVLQTPKVKDQLFADFDGTVKSLGAWGGDFVLAVTEKKDDDLKKYFKQKGFATVLNYGEMIKTLKN